jgi:hypothetical protein
MRGAMKFGGWLLAGVLVLPVAGLADTQNTPQHHVRKAAKKQELPAPLPSGPQGPVPQVPLDAMPAVPPQVSYQDGLLTIVAPNSTLGDILRGVHKQTSADIEVPANATERVVTRLGPAPAREVMAELLNGSRFNYILLGSPENANSLVRVVLVAKTPDTPAAPPGVNENPRAAAGVEPAEAAETETPDETPDDQQDQNAESDQPANPDQPAVKTPQQMLQEMQQRQLQMQQQGQQPGQPPFPGRPGVPTPPQQQQNQ